MFLVHPYFKIFPLNKGFHFVSSFWNPWHKPLAWMNACASHPSEWGTAGSLRRPRPRGWVQPTALAWSLLTVRCLPGTLTAPRSPITSPSTLTDPESQCGWVPGLSALLWAHHLSKDQLPIGHNPFWTTVVFSYIHPIEYFSIRTFLTAQKICDVVSIHMHM